MRLVLSFILLLTFICSSYGQSGRQIRRDTESNWGYLEIENINYSLKNNTIEIVAIADKIVYDVGIEYMQPRFGREPLYLPVLVIGRKKTDADYSNINVKYNLKIDLGKNNGLEGVEIIGLKKTKYNNLINVAIKVPTNFKEI